MLHSDLFFNGMKVVFWFVAWIAIDFAQRLLGLVVFAFVDIPHRAFWDEGKAEKHCSREDNQQSHWNSIRSSTVNAFCPLVDAGADELRPRLHELEHHECWATDLCGCNFANVNEAGRRELSDSETNKDAANAEDCVDAVRADLDNGTTDDTE